MSLPFSPTKKPAGTWRGRARQTSLVAAGFKEPASLVCSSTESIIALRDGRKGASAARPRGPDGDGSGSPGSLLRRRRRAAAPARPRARRRGVELGRARSRARAPASRPRAGSSRPRRPVAAPRPAGAPPLPRRPPAAVEGFLAGPALHTDVFDAGRALVADDPRSDLGAVRCPCLVLSGARDRMVPVADAIEYARRLRAPLRIVPDCGHLLIGERPEACVEAIAELVAIPPAPPAPGA